MEHDYERRQREQRREMADLGWVGRAGHAPIAEPTDAQKALMAMARVLMRLHERVVALEERAERDDFDPVAP